MTRHPHPRPNSRETRRLLSLLIDARQAYAEYLRGVASGQRQIDNAEKALLKLQCDETLIAWRAAHEAWQVDVFPERNRSEKEQTGTTVPLC